MIYTKFINLRFRLIFGFNLSRFSMEKLFYLQENETPSGNREELIDRSRAIEVKETVFCILILHSRWNQRLR